MPVQVRKFLGNSVFFKDLLSNLRNHKWLLRYLQKIKQVFLFFCQHPFKSFIVHVFRCHSQLSNISIIIFRLGVYGLKLNTNQYFSNCYKAIIQDKILKNNISSFVCFLKFIYLLISDSLMFTVFDPFGEKEYSVVFSFQ